MASEESNKDAFSAYRLTIVTDNMVAVGIRPLAHAVKVAAKRLGYDEAQSLKVYRDARLIP